MPVSSVTYGDASSSRTIRITRGNCIPAISVPSGEQTGQVTITYTLWDLRAGTASIIAEYSTDNGSTWNQATEGSGSDGTNNLSTSATAPGQSHTFVWDTVTDLGVAWSADIVFRIRAYDQPNWLGSYEVSNSATIRVDNAPGAPGIVSPADSYFTKDQTPTFTGTIPDPVAGGGKLHFKLEIDTDPSFGSPTVFESRLDQTGWEYDSTGTGNWVDLPQGGVDVVSDPTLIGNQVRYTIQTTDRLSRAIYYWRMTAGDAG